LKLHNGYGKSFNALNKIYFFTATIHKWLPLLNEDERKDLIIEYLKKLLDNNYVQYLCICNYPESYSYYLAASKLKWQRNTVGQLFKIYRPRIFKAIKKRG